MKITQVALAVFLPLLAAVNGRTLTGARSPKTRVRKLRQVRRKLQLPPGCQVEIPEWVGDGFCDIEGGYNTAECGCDGGDCCVGTCVDGALSAEQMLPSTVKIRRSLRHRLFYLTTRTARFHSQSGLETASVTVKARTTRPSVALMVETAAWAPARTVLLSVE